MSYPQSPDFPHQEFIRQEFLDRILTMHKKIIANATDEIPKGKTGTSIFGLKDQRGEQHGIIHMSKYDEGYLIETFNIIPIGIPQTDSSGFHGSVVFFSTDDIAKSGFKDENPKDILGFEPTIKLQVHGVIADQLNAKALREQQENKITGRRLNNGYTDYLLNDTGEIAKVCVYYKDMQETHKNPIKDNKIPYDDKENYDARLVPVTEDDIEIVGMAYKKTLQAFEESKRKETNQ